MLFVQLLYKVFNNVKCLYNVPTYSIWNASEWTKDLDWLMLPCLVPKHRTMVCLNVKVPKLIMLYSLKWLIHYFLNAVRLRWLDAQLSYILGTSSTNQKGWSKWTNAAAHAARYQHNCSWHGHLVAAQQTITWLCKCSAKTPWTFYLLTNPIMLLCMWKISVSL